MTSLVGIFEFRRPSMIVAPGTDDAKVHAAIDEIWMVVDAAPETVTMSVTSGGTVSFTLGSVSRFGPEPGMFDFHEELSEFLMDLAAVRPG